MTELWAALLSVAHVAGAVAVTVHAVMHKRHVHAVIGWVGMAWFAPLAGSILYLLLGINRIQRAAVGLRLERELVDNGVRREGAMPEAAGTQSARLGPALHALARVGQQVTGRPLASDNRIDPLENGDNAYPAMLEAIAQARCTIGLLTYIFDDDGTGRRFVEALAAAHARGVQVRVLIDDVGARYSRPSVLRRLAAAGVTVATFLPTRMPRLRYANLRNHRKLLVVDGHTGFTGGMNIRDGHCFSLASRVPVQCIHFRVIGPVVADLQRAFGSDWAFATGERLDSAAWFPPLAFAGPVLARGLPDGPDADLDNIPHVLHAAISVAVRSIRVVTPYFLPDEVLLRALQVAAMRGVEVDIVVPGRSNLPLMDWAMAPQFTELIERGCRIHRTPAPFDHSKLLVVDGLWCLIGSTNWDARSLRLNFEYNLECYDTDLAQRLDLLVEKRIAVAHRVTPEALAATPFLFRLRNGITRLLSPYL